jgi:mercuric ion transport protein
MTSNDAEPRVQSTTVRWARWLLALDAWLLVLSLLGQAYAAGMAVFANPAWWPRHVAFVHAFQWLSPLALVLAFVARAPRSVKALAGITVALLWLQYTTADMRLREATHAWAALHPVSAILLFWTATELARRARWAEA